MEKLIDINDGGFSIRTKFYCNDLRKISKVILVSHGFGGSKDTNQTTHFAEKCLSKYKTCGVLAFDWPCHGQDARKKLVLAECCTYVDLILKYIKEQWNTEEVYMYATSFGGYITLKYLHDQGNPFRKIALRSPAIDMYHSLYEIGVNPMDRDKLAKGKDILVGRERKIKVNQELFDELRTSDVTTYDYLDYADDLLIIHGTADDTVNFEMVQNFAEENVIEFVPVEGADHRFRNPKQMDLVVHTILTFFME